MTLITLALVDNLLSSKGSIINILSRIQECESAKEAWDKLNSRSAERTIINKIGILNSF